MYEGISERLLIEIEKRVPESTKVKVIASPDRRFAVWRGGSIIASIPSFSSRWITKEEYDDYGSNIALKKWI